MIYNILHCISIVKRIQALLVYDNDKLYLVQTTNLLGPQPFVPGSQPLARVEDKNEACRVTTLVPLSFQGVRCSQSLCGLKMQANRVVKVSRTVMSWNE